MDLYMRRHLNILKNATQYCKRAQIYGAAENTNFGANEFTDGITYAEQQKHKKITQTKHASLATNKYFVTLP